MTVKHINVNRQILEVANLFCFSALSMTKRQSFVQKARVSSLCDETLIRKETISLDKAFDLIYESY